MSDKYDEAFRSVWEEYGFDKSYANAYPAHSNASFAREMFAHGISAERARMQPALQQAWQLIWALEHDGRTQGIELNIEALRKALEGVK